MSPRTAIVIGSGAGGLSAAAYLARGGVDVTVLERAKQLGGYINPFKRRHFEFDPGVHYVGECGPDGQITRVLGDLGLDAGAMFCRMDEDGFDAIRFPDFELRIPAGLERYRARLVDAFPQEVRGIDRYLTYVRTVRDVAAAGGALSSGGLRWRHLGPLVRAARLGRWIRAPFSQLLAHCTRDPKLRAVLAGQCGDYGLPPSRASALLGVAITAHYADGAWFPRGGSRALRDGLVEAGASGGAVYRRFTEVTAVRTRAGRAVGVTTADGEQLDADIVVGAIEPSLLFGSLLPDDDVPARLRRKVAGLTPSVGSLSIFLGLQRDLRAHGFGAFNVWDYPDWDLEAQYAPVLKGRLPEDWFVFLSPNSLKDDSGTMAPDGGSTLEIVTFAPYEYFEAWDGQRALKRSDGYAERKEALADRVLASVERRYPGVVADIALREVGTPVSNSYYAHAVRGGAYGPAATPDQSILFRFPTKTPVRGLYLAGSGVLGGGVAPALESGRLAAMAALRQAR